MIYAVVRFGRAWSVLSDGGRRIGRFDAPDDALHVGARLAHEAYSAGHEVELLVQDDAGRLMPFPPYCAR